MWCEVQAKKKKIISTVHFLNLVCKWADCGTHILTTQMKNNSPECMDIEMINCQYCIEDLTSLLHIVACPSLVLLHYKEK